MADDERVAIAEQDSAAEQPALQNDASEEASASAAPSVASANGHQADELPPTSDRPTPAADQAFAALDQPAPAEDMTWEAAADAISIANTDGTAPLDVRGPEPVPEGMEWDEAPTVVIAPSEPTPMQPLPLGAVLADKYVLRGTLSHDQEQNIYRAASIADDELYTIVESTQQDARGNQQVTGEGLSHPHLMPVIDLFTYQPYGDTPRYYAVSIAAEVSLLLSDLDVALPIEQALAWANELAEALNYLHEQGVYSPRLTPDNILVENGHALIGGLSAVQMAADGEGEQETLRRHDVAQLAQIIAYAMSGSRNVDPATLPLLRGADDQPLPDPIQLALGTALAGEQGSARAFYADLFAAWRAAVAAPTDQLLHSGKLSHIGMLRRNNQDSLAAMECVMMVQSLSGACGVYVVADGMGGHKAGEVASAIAVNAVIASLLGSTIAPLYSEESANQVIVEQTMRERIIAAIQEANQQVNAMRLREGNDMGTTVVAALVIDGRLYIGNVGDSRAYHYRPAVDLRQLTADHSLVARLVELGELNDAEAAAHPHRHVIFRSLGEKPRVEVDTFIEPLQAGDRVLLCSDGLSGMVSNADMATVLASEPDPQAAAQRLVELANAHGGVDNISVIVVNVEQAVMNKPVMDLPE
ncbi:MAG: Stp1/IreP family PP2C-type Ser/Thr phosphatase [Candidatus Chloroheliales bacterium]|nr:MAG: Stp1/IreP family PP2C-type Ser/Thr phosphatase [Chloroflexota bacterium]